MANCDTTKDETYPTNGSRKQVPAQSTHEVYVPLDDIATDEPINERPEYSAQGGGMSESGDTSTVSQKDADQHPCERNSWIKSIGNAFIRKFF